MIQSNHHKSIKLNSLDALEVQTKSDQVQFNQFNSFQSSPIQNSASEIQFKWENVLQEEIVELFGLGLDKGAKEMIEENWRVLK